MTNGRLMVIGVLALAIVGAGTLVVAGTLLYFGREVPGELWQYGGTALGALAGIVTGQAVARQTPPAPPADGGGA